MKAIPNGIPGVIEAAAEERGLSLAALAAKTRMSYDSVLRKVRRRERAISMEDLQEFADALEVPGSELVRRAEEAAENPSDLTPVEQIERTGKPLATSQPLKGVTA